MKLNEAGIDLIKHFEGCKLTAYQDTGGVWTIGWGHTGPYVHDGLVITQRKADEMLLKDLHKSVFSAQQVWNEFPIEPSGDQFSATVSFIYNVRHGAMHLKDMLTQYGLQGFPMKCDYYIHDKMGKVLEGLRRRRSAEKSLYLSEPRGF